MPVEHFAWWGRQEGKGLLGSDKDDRRTEEEDREGQKLVVLGLSTSIGIGVQFIGDWIAALVHGESLQVLVPLGNYLVMVREFASSQANAAEGKHLSGELGRNHLGAEKEYQQEIPTRDTQTEDLCASNDLSSHFYALQ